MLELGEQPDVSDDHGIFHDERTEVERQRQRRGAQVPDRVGRAAGVGGRAQPGRHGDRRHAPHDEPERPPLVLGRLGVIQSGN